MQRRLVAALVLLLFGAAAANPDLFRAASEGDRDALLAALEAGADVDARDAYGQTPLMYAISHAQPTDVIELLVRRGADVNARTEAGWTPLMYAARDLPDDRRAEVVLLLYRAGADPTATNGEGRMASDYLAPDPPLAARPAAPEPAAPRPEPVPTDPPADPFEALVDALAREAGFAPTCRTRDAFYERQWCGRREAHMPFETFLRHWEEALRRADAGRGLAVPRSGWSFGRGVHVAFYDLAGGSLGVSFDPNAGLVMLTLR